MLGGGGFEGEALVFEVLFHGGEAVFELRVGVGHEEFGVGVAEAGEVDDGEEQVAEFFVDVCGVAV